MDDWLSERLSIKIVTIIIILIICIYFVDGFTIDSVSTVYDNKGNTVAEVGMTKDEIISQREFWTVSR